MTLQLKVRKLGNSLGVVLPKEAAAILNVEEGDQLYITEAPGGFRITAADPEFARQMAVAEKGMRTRCDRSPRDTSSGGGTRRRRDDARCSGPETRWRR